MSLLFQANCSASDFKQKTKLFYFFKTVVPKLCYKQTLSKSKFHIAMLKIYGDTISNYFEQIFQ